ncbi:type II toxin-antitoxin system VapC family toxin [uncultured Rhodospira sp.]|uniref:type II toxin-antitoxin system VapC family toxin n=1 Tax=uncultured Rhodospira sp. TaxID=1936189 RepID=UPI002623FBE2|nr:type II toxin-antitoxin system VapC family toxin [uncultured Rhodospira sp.]
MAEKRIYWDSCCFISLIQQEDGRFPICRSIYTAAEKGDLVIVTSTLTLSEVCKVRCEDGKTREYFQEQHDHLLDRFWDNDFFDIIDLSPSIATHARNLFRRHPKIKKPNDAIHLATALFSNCDEMHTFDGNDLLGLSGTFRRRDGEALVIGPPQPLQHDLVTLAKKEDDLDGS